MKIRLPVLAADHLVDAQQILAFAEAVEEHRHSADVHGVRAQPHQVGADALQLGQHHPHPLGAGGDFESQELFHCQHVAQIVDHGAEVVDAIG